MKTHQRSIKIINVVGARPNFMKIAPLYRAYKHYANIKPVLVHTGQHYDYEMSGIFLKSLGIPTPDYNLGIGHGSHAVQTAQTMLGFEKILLKEKPDLVLTVGDVNSTLAVALTASKIGIKIAHVEAGLRSFDISMPEEINRILTDHISDFLFVTEKAGVINLMKENLPKNKIFVVGNTMIDNLKIFLPQIKQSTIIDQLSLTPKRFAVITMHRPINVDSKKGLLSIAKALAFVTKKIPIVFPVHPRTQQNIKKMGLSKRFNKIKGLKIIPPLAYFDLIKLILESKMVMTDSGGIQAEAAYLKTPILTFRESTEHLSTIDCGANRLVDFKNRTNLMAALNWATNVTPSAIKHIPYDDGGASERIIGTIVHKLNL
ncbi:MAG: UDP-N-acetylglucosamine 2-epimerase (non-hydrolyzing) [Candidatus Paceibacterota bacterium]|jgi:UDP-N-acetylglucosamine 2-epimerase (non-hydrolysing)